MVDSEGLLKNATTLWMPYPVLICADWLKEQGEDALAEFLIVLALVRNFPAVPVSMSVFSKGSPQANHHRAGKLAAEHGDHWASILPDFIPLFRSCGWKPPEERAVIANKIEGQTPKTAERKSTGRKGRRRRSD